MYQDVCAKDVVVCLIMIERSVRPNTHSKQMKQGVELAETERVNTSPLHVLQATIKTANIKSLHLLFNN